MEKNRWLQQQFQDLNVNSLAQQQQMFKQQYDMKGKKTRSYALISSDEIFEKWDKGLCELCDELYVPGHKCKKVSSNYVIVVVDEEEDMRQPDSEVEDPPAMDAHQVLDESPKSNPDICSDGWVGEGQGKMPVGSQNTVCEQLNGLNPSNDLLEQSDLCVQEELDEDANSGICMEEELPTLAGYSKALGLKSAVPELKVPNLPAHQIPKNLGWKEAIGSCELVFDPGILGPGPSTLQPDIVVFNSILNAYVPSHQWKAVSWVLEQLKKGGLKTNSAAYGLAMEVMLHSKKYDLAHELFEKVNTSPRGKEACSGNGDSPPAPDRHADGVGLETSGHAHQWDENVTVPEDSHDYIRLKGGSSARFKGQVEGSARERMSVKDADRCAMVQKEVATPKLYGQSASEEVYKLDPLYTEDHGWKWTKCFSFIVFDPEKLRSPLYGRAEASPSQRHKLLQALSADIAREIDDHATDITLFSRGKKCWFYGWKEANGFYLFVFDPGKLGVGQSTLQPKPLAFMYARMVEILAPSKVSVVIFVFDPGEERVTTVFSSDPEKFVSWHTSAQVIADVAGIKVSREEWPDRIGSLLNNMTQTVSSASLKQTTLDTLGDVSMTVILAGSAQNSHVDQVDRGMEIFESMCKVRPIDPRMEHYACASHGDSVLGQYASAQLLLLAPENPAPYVQLTNIFSAKGKWRDRAMAIKKMTEGRLSKENATAFETQRALFALAVSDIVLIHMRCHDIRREQAANIPLSKTVFQVMMRLFSFCKTTLVFVIRDNTRTPLETLELVLREDIQMKWDAEWEHLRVSISMVLSMGLTGIVHNICTCAWHAAISAFATPQQSPHLALQPRVVFDPGGMILLLPWLLLHTIHNLKAEGAVFDPGKVDVLRSINDASGWSGAGERKVMEGRFYARPVAEQAQGAVADVDELKDTPTSIFGVPSLKHFLTTGGVFFMGGGNLIQELGWASRHVQVM